MRKLIFLSLLLIAAAFAVMAFNYPSDKNSVKSINPPQDQVAPVFPDAVQKVFETSCFDCHGEAASNTKAKMKLNLGKWSDMSDAKKVGKMQDINEKVSKGDMPPKKYAEKYPANVPGQEEKDIINKWVTEESAKLMGE